MDSGCIYKIVMGTIIRKLTSKEDYVMQCYTQAGKITNNSKVKIGFTLPEFSATEIVTWIYHVDDSTKIRYDTILGRYMLKELGLNLKF